MKQSTFGSIIRSLREQNNLTQAALAEKLGVTDKAVSKWERDISYPDISLFPKLADVLGVTTDDLLKESTREGQPSRLLQIFEMSHDIRTPLHMILGCVDMAEHYCDDKALLRRYLESIRISGQYLLQVVDRTLQMTQTDAGEIFPEEYPANLDELGELLEKTGRQEGVPSERYDFSGKRILVAEDMELNREIAKEVLSQTGAAVEFAENGKICVEMIERASAGYYDLVLMDILMPVMDGIEATRRIRSNRDEAKAAIPIIAMTANVYEKDRHAAFEAGMNAFTEKPVFADKLFRSIREIFQK